jgi:hypothetical protein
MTDNTLLTLLPPGMDSASWYILSTSSSKCFSRTPFRLNLVHRFAFSYNCPQLIASKDRSPPGYWKQRENRRQFLIDLASSKGLDPFCVNTWYYFITTKDIIANKVQIAINRTLCKHNNFSGRKHAEYDVLSTSCS